MSDKLAVVGQQAIQAGGIGFGNRLFKLKPQYIELVQPSSKKENVVYGKFRVSATNQHLDDIVAVLLFEPEEQRSMYIGEDFSKDAKVCFSLDGVEPHEQAKIPQAMKCAGCPSADWSAYIADKKKNKGKGDRKLMPACRNYYHLVLINRTTKMPYYFDVRGTAIQDFEGAMQSIAGMANLLQQQEQINPNIFDFSFKMTPYKKKGDSYFSIQYSDFKALNPEDRKEFGAIYLDFVQRRQRGEVEDQVAAENETANAAVNNAVAEPGAASGTTIEGEPITI